MSESTIESVDKINHTHSHSLNYWAPLATILEEEEEEEILEQALLVIKPKNENKLETMIIDSAATSHFATETIVLPQIGIPSTKQTTRHTQKQFGRESNPNLQKPFCLHPVGR